jgi:TatD DNase family protein
MELIDTHCHLPSLKHEEHLKSVLVSAQEAEVSLMVNIGTNLKNSLEAIKVAEAFPQVYASVGIYPHEELDKNPEELLKGLEELIVTHKKVVGVGECGFDITAWQGGRNVEDQEVVFRNQIELAIKYNLPLIIHNRGADELTLKVIQEYRVQGVYGVLHCFASTWDVAKKFLEMGFYISFSGFVTRPSRKELHEVAKQVPNDWFVLETDSPYIVPHGLKESENQPKNVRIVAQTVADIIGVDISSIATYSTQNAKKLFALKRSNGKIFR